MIYRRSVPLGVLVLAIAAVAFCAPARADTLKVTAAGSLRAAMTDLLQHFPKQSDEVDTPGVRRVGPDAAEDRKWRSMLMYSHPLIWNSRIN